MSQVSREAGIRKGVRILQALETEEVQQQRQQHTKQLRITKRQLDEAMEHPKSHGYGQSKWKPRRELTGEMRRKILRLMLHSGVPAPHNLENRTEPLTVEETRSTLRAFLVTEKLEAMSKDDVVRDPKLWDVSVWERRQIHADEANERVQRARAHRDHASFGQDPLRPDIGREMRGNQHLRRYFRVFHEEGIVVISNVPYVPDLPPPPATKRVRENGHTGYHDPTRYPQKHVPGVWHPPFGPSFAGTHSNVDDDIAWLDLDLIKHCVLERQNMYSPNEQLKKAITRACERQIEVFDRNRTYALGAPYTAAMTMQSAASYLCGHIFNANELRVVFAGFQESLLELRAWDNYKTALELHRRLVRKLSLDQAEWLRPAPQGNIRKEFRGVFVTDLETANIYGHLQVPVWWMRALSDRVVYFLNSHSFIEITTRAQLPRPALGIMPGAQNEGASLGSLYATNQVRASKPGRASKQVRWQDHDDDDDGMDEDRYGEYEEASEGESDEDDLPWSDKRTNSQKTNTAAALSKFKKATRGGSSSRRGPHGGSSSRGGHTTSMTAGRDPTPELWTPADYKRMHQQSTSTSVASSSGTGANSTASRGSQADTQSTVLHLPQSVDPGLRTGLQQLREPVTRLPPAVPKGTKRDALYTLHVDASTLHHEEGAIVPINKLLDKVFQLNNHSLSCSELAGVIRQGPLGMDGVCTFLEGASRVLGGQAGLLKPRVDRLIDAIQTLVPQVPGMAATAAPTSTTTSASMTIIEDDNQMSINNDPIYDADVPMNIDDDDKPAVPPAVPSIAPPAVPPGVSKSSKGKKRKRGGQKRPKDNDPVDYYAVNTPHYDFPEWFPNELCWPADMFQIDESRERMKMLYYDEDDPVKYRRQGYVFRTPRAELFVNDAKADLMLAVWLIIRPFVLRMLVLIGLGLILGFTRDGWRKLLKVTCSNEKCLKFIADLGLDAASSSPSITEPEVEVEERSLNAADLDLEVDDDVDANVFGIPASFVEQVTAASGSTEEGGSANLAAGDSTGSTGGHNDDDDDDDDDDDGIGVHAWYFANEADEDEDLPRSELDRHLAEPADWHDRGRAGFEYFIENSDGIMCRMSHVIPGFLDIVNRLECWFDYEKNRKLFFRSSLRDRGQSNPDLQGERLLAHPPPAGEEGLRWQGMCGESDEPSRRIWPARSSPPTPPVPRSAPAPMQPSTTSFNTFPWADPNHQLKFAHKIRELAGSTRYFDGHPLPPLEGRLPESMRAYFVWELEEIQFRAALYRVDYEIRQSHPRFDNDGLRRETQLRACWGGGSLKPDESSPSPFSSRERTPAMLKALVAMFNFMIQWPRAEKILKCPESPWTLDDIDDLAKMVWRCYAQTHFDYLRYEAPKPYISPPLPWSS